MVGVIDTIVQIAPILGLFFMMGITALVLYQTSVLSSAYSRMGRVVAETHAIFFTMFGEEGMKLIQDYEHFMGDFGPVMKHLEALRDRARALVVPPGTTTVKEGET